MDITTLLFGNGLGLALNAHHFNLAAGINEIWSSCYAANEKNIIALGKNNPPISEQSLEDHHLILSATQILSKFKNENIDWLHQNGAHFEKLYAKFIFDIACHFYNYQGGLPEDFVISMRDYIRKPNTITHVATLNYDKLLYSSLYEKGFLQGYQDQGLVDGFYNDTTGFHPEHLERRKFQFGWYLHLHGPPLFYTNEFGDVFKDLHYDLTFSTHPDRNHMVLAPTKLKPSIISNSFLLDYYLEYFSLALSESSVLYLIGYSGRDVHINHIIKRWISVKNKIRIIEWDGVAPFEERKKYWATLFNLSEGNFTPTNLILLDNILRFRFSNE